MTYLDVVIRAFGSVNGILESIAKAKDIRLGKSGVRNMVLAELELNISLLVHDYLQHGMGESEIIKNLSSQEIMKAMEANFDFSEIRKGKLKKEKLPAGDYYRKLEGFNSEQLFRKIFVKISELKRAEIIHQSADKDKMRLGVRLKNLLKLLMVTAMFVSKK